MALKEGQCPNCGSLLQLDDKNEQGHCLFCDAVFESSAAYAIAANPAGVTFPNLPQPKYEGPNLNPQLSAAQANVRATQLETTRKKEAKAAAKAAEPTYMLREDLHIPDLTLPFKTRLMLGLVALILVAAIAAATLPLILKREAVRADLLAAVGDYVPVAVDTDKQVVIHGLNNQRLDVVLPEAVTADEAAAIFTAYGASRAALKSTDVNDFAKAYGDLTVKIIFPTGGFLIEKPQDQAKLADGTAVQVLS